MKLSIEQLKNYKEQLSNQLLIIQGKIQVIDELIQFEEQPEPQNNNIEPDVSSDAMNDAE